MNWTDGYTQIEDQKVYFQRWQPEKSPEAQVLLVHGLGEHSTRYSHVGEFLCHEGIALTGFDLLGHGKTEGQRGHAESYDEYCRQVDFFLKDLHKDQPQAPVFLYGHSMGGLIVLYYMLNKKPQDIKGVVCTSPGLATGFPVPAWKTTLGNLLYKFVPRFSMDNGLPIDGISHDQDVVRAYKADPLNHSKISARMGMDLIRNGRDISEKATDFPCPMLLMVGEKDYLIDPAAVIELGQNSGNKTTLKVWENGFHELHNEPFKQDVLKTITEWIKNNLEP